MGRSKVALVTGTLFACAIFFVPPHSVEAALDSGSKQCIGCHSDAVGGTGASLVHKGGLSHPVGVDYTGLSSKRPGLKPQEALDPAIKLVDGRIGCVTCHVPYSSETDHRRLAEKRRNSPSAPDPMLSVDNSGSRLCLACHDK